MESWKGFRLRYNLGVDGENKTIYENVDLDKSVYEDLFKNFIERKFVEKIETSYEYVVSNYGDYEKFNYSAALDHYLDLNVDPYRKITAEKNSDRHISNILTSTYIYVCVLKIDKTENIESILQCKRIFQEMANKCHEEMYQFTLLSALRNKINHGGTMNTSTSLSPTWSVKYATSENDESILIKTKNKRHLFFDHIVTKVEAKRILKSSHYDNVQASMPEEFYLRQAIRVYIDSLSNMHAKLRGHFTEIMDSTNDIFSRNLKKPDKYFEVSLLKNINGTVEETNMGNVPFSQVNGRQKMKAPLYLQHMPLPGEDSAVADAI